MIMNYNEAEKFLDEIRNKDEMMFRMAVSHLMDVGIRHLTPDNVEHTCEEIMKQDDNNAIISNYYQCKIVKTAAKLAEISHIYLLAYISQNIKYNV